MEKLYLNLSMVSSKSERNHSGVLVFYVLQVQAYYSKKGLMGNDQKGAISKWEGSCVSIR